jgi:hypothetical protein
MRILGRSSTLHPGPCAPVRAQKQPSWPWARLASFHRWSSRGTPSSAIALTRFCVSTALSARSIRSGLRSPDLTRISVLPSAPPSGFDHPLGGLIPIGLAQQLSPRAALARFTLRSFPSTRTVPVSRPLPSCGSLVAFHAPAAGPFQGFVSRSKYLEVLDRPSGSPLGFPSGVSCATLAAGFVLPCHPPARFSCAPPCGETPVAPWSVA